MLHSIRAQSRATAPLHRKKPIEVDQASCKDASWPSSICHIQLGGGYVVDRALDREIGYGYLHWPGNTSVFHSQNWLV